MRIGIDSREDLIATGVTLALFTGFVGTLFWPMYQEGVFTDPTTTPAYGELMALHSRVKLGMSRAEIDEMLHGISDALHSSALPELGLIRVVTTPTHIAANNRIMYVYFDTEDKVAAVLIRVVDSFAKYHVIDPEDRIAPGFVRP